MSNTTVPEGLRDHFEGVLREKQAVIDNALGGAINGPLTLEQQARVRQALEKSRQAEDESPLSMLPQLAMLVIGGLIMSILYVFTGFNSITFILGLFDSFVAPASSTSSLSETSYSTTASAKSILTPAATARAALIADSAEVAAANALARCPALQWQPWASTAIAADHGVAATWAWVTDLGSHDRSIASLSADESASVTAAVIPYLSQPPSPPHALSSAGESALTAAAASLPLPFTFPLPPIPTGSSYLARARSWAHRLLRGAGRLRALPPALADWITGDAEAEANPFCGAHGSGPEWGSLPGQPTVGLEALVAYLRSQGPATCWLSEQDKALLAEAAVSNTAEQWPKQRRDAAASLVSPPPFVNVQSFVSAAAAAAGAAAAARLSEALDRGLAIAPDLPEATAAWGATASARAAAVASVVAADVCTRVQNSAGSNALADVDKQTRARVLERACARGQLAFVCMGGLQANFAPVDRSSSVAGGKESVQELAQNHDEL